MTRPRGGFIGHNAAPAASAVNSAASGVWTLREAEALKRAGTWPRAGEVPEQISGLQLWLDAASSSTLYDATSGGSLVAADGGVARWEDKSGNGRHATQSTAANRPARKTAIQGGLDVLRADGTNDFLQTSAFSSDLVRSIFVVAISRETPQVDTFASLVCQADGDFGSGDADPWLIGTTSTGTGSSHDRLRGIIRNAANTAFIQNFVDTAFVTGTPFVTSYINNGTGVFRFGASASTFPTAGLHATITKNISIFAQANADFTNSTNFWDGDIAEILVYDSALSDANRQAVETYLMAKWGIA